MGICCDRNLLAGHDYDDDGDDIDGVHDGDDIDGVHDVDDADVVGHKAVINEDTFEYMWTKRIIQSIRCKNPISRSKSKSSIFSSLPTLCI